MDAWNPLKSSNLNVAFQYPGLLFQLLEIWLRFSDFHCDSSRLATVASTGYLQQCLIAFTQWCCWVLLGLSSKYKGWKHRKHPGHVTSPHTRHSLLGKDTWVRRENGRTCKLWYKLLSFLLWSSHKKTRKGEKNTSKKHKKVKMFCFHKLFITTVL